MSVFTDKTVLNARPEGVSDKENESSVGVDIFRRGLCLPSDNKMTAEEQDIIIELIRSCFE